MRDFLYDTIKKLFVLDDDLLLTDDMGPGDVPGWDSIGGINLVNIVQQKFNVDLTLEEIAMINSIKDLRKLISTKGKFDI